ncbi:MAG: extracellular solute-binding protein [Dehalococcoidia bacterium]|nr:extracellular solute-binding protein [Dehalococcoidia bacterium]
MKQPEQSQIDRRSFLRVTTIAAAGGLAAACAPAAPAPAPSVPVPAQPAGSKQEWEKQWEELVAAAKKEGEIVYDVTRSTSGAERHVVPDFQAAFPGIRVTQTVSDSSNVFAQKVLQEQNAGLFTWDLLFMSTAPFLSLIPAGALTPLRSLIFRPDVLNDKVWNGGFDAGWNDAEKKWGYTANINLGPGVWINTDMVADGELKTVEDLLNPKWRGRIAWSDPRINGFGWGPLIAARVARGDQWFREFAQKLLIEQKPALNRDTRQITEWMVRGNYAIGVGVVAVPVLAEFRAQGLGKNLKTVPLADFRYAASYKPAWLPKQVPHPNAAKLFLNWWLTKDGNTSWSKGAEANSRRKDIPIIDKDVYADPEKPLPFMIDTQEGAKESDKTITIIKEILA